MRRSGQVTARGVVGRLKAVVPEGRQAGEAPRPVRGGGWRPEPAFGGADVVPGVRPGGAVSAGGCGGPRCHGGGAGGAVGLWGCVVPRCGTGGERIRLGVRGRGVAGVVRPRRRPEQPWRECAPCVGQGAAGVRCPPV